jgi:hypothetical protein
LVGLLTRADALLGQEGIAPGVDERLPSTRDLILTVA